MPYEERKSLIPAELAFRGFRFIFEGITDICRSCRLKSACVDGLEEGRVYEVMEIFPKKKFECPLHGKLILVTLRRANIIVALPSGVIEGATIHYRPIECELVTCKNFQYCRPDGLKPGDKIRLVKEIGPFKSSCSKTSGFKIYEVEVKY